MGPCAFLCTFVRAVAVWDGETRKLPDETNLPKFAALPYVFGRAYAYKLKFRLQFVLVGIRPGCFASQNKGPVQVACASGQSIKERCGRMRVDLRPSNPPSTSGYHGGWPGGSLQIGFGVCFRSVTGDSGVVNEGRRRSASPPEGMKMGLIRGCLRGDHAVA